MAQLVKGTRELKARELAGRIQNGTPGARTATR